MSGSATDQDHRTTISAGKDLPITPSVSVATATIEYLPAAGAQEHLKSRIMLNIFILFAVHADEFVVCIEFHFGDAHH